MQKILKNMFTNDKFLLASLYIGIAIPTISLLLSCFADTDSVDYIMLFYYFISIACLTALYYAYYKHAKNVMKGLMGCILVSELYNCAYMAFGKEVDTMNALFSGLYIFILIMIMYNHFIINSDHHSSPNNIFVNQLLVLVALVVNIIWNVWPPLGDWSVLNIIFDVLGGFATLSSIVCIESRLDGYRLDREAAGWSEEKGYPQGYKAKS